MADTADDAAIRSGAALFDALGGFHVTGWDAASRTLQAAFTVRPAFCHTHGTTAQGGFITAWLDASMAHAVLYDTDQTQTISSLEIKVSFLERVGPGPGRTEARIIRRGARVAFLSADLITPDGKLAATATSTGLIIPALPK
jgi:acyl-CoA thioesterase